MIFNKNTKTISKGMAVGILATSIMPTIAINENVEASKVKSSKVVEVTCDALNVRTGSSTKYSIAGTVRKGTKLEYISTCSNGWYKVKYKGSTRYVSNKYSKLKSDSTSTSTSKTVEVTASRVNIRSGAGTKYSIVDTVIKGTKFKYISRCSNGWYKVEYKGRTRYITDKYTKISGLASTSDSIKKVGKVTASALNVRSGASTKYSVKKTIKMNSVVGVISSYSNGWSKVKLSSSTTGYVCTKYLKVYAGDSSDIKVSYKTASSSSSNKPSSSSKLDTVLSTIKAQVGKPYVYGAAGPNSFDCSGLTYYAYKKSGTYLNRTSRDQAKNGKYVSRSNLKAGDLVFFNSGTNSIKHVGMYVGNGKFIHSPSPGKSVKYENLSTSYYAKGYVTARRIIY
ncbi:SH3 domain-containing protein [Terrisporobacter vanillatitrophus]|uniref:C40 family peptidase n=1 Tax=Terrisporobacter vanillatitrophus TaxID=3058402 RepID=UPI003369A9EF